MSPAKENLYHVTLRQETLGSAEAKSAALDRLLRVAGTTDYNVRRFDKHGILSVVVHDSSCEEALRHDPAVEGVEVDSIMHAI